MKVGVVTFHCCMNYGAVLQATALVQCLRESGIDARIIDRRAGAARVLDPWTSLRAMVRNLLTLRHYGPLSLRTRRTLDFVLTNQTLTDRYEDIADTVARWPEMDAYVAGSDQVWNVDRHVNPIFFLLPADPARARLISYAASFGAAKFPENRRTVVAEALRRFHAISVREQSGAAIVDSLIGRAPVVVCDPVFLHSREHYRQLERPYPIPKDYILVHSIGMDPNLDFAVRAAKERLGLPVLQFLWGTGRSSAAVLDRKIMDAGPAEYLFLMRNASVVCTNSFHGTAFSLVMRRPFLSTAALAGRNTRIEHLLQTFEEQGRSVRAGMVASEIAWARLMSCDADRWAHIHMNLRKVGLNFLSKALGHEVGASLT